MSATPATPPSTVNAADRALWITWYDLKDGARDAYLAWLHGSYIPRQLERPGFLWAAHYEAEENLIAWFAQSRLPSMTKMPGSVRTRKLVSVCGWAKHAILYEFVSIAARNEIFLHHEEKTDPEAAQWSDRIVRTVRHAPGSPSVARWIFSRVAGRAR